MYFFCLFTAAVFAFPEIIAKQKFEHFVNQFNRHEKYGSDVVEWAGRYEIFKQNLKKIEEHNARNLSYTLGVTRFADMTEGEFSLWLETQAGYHNKEFTQKRLNRTRRYSTLEACSATSVDWTAKGAVTPVKNQASCGSCWAFSTTGAIEGAVAIASGTLTSLSEQELVDCGSETGNDGCQGGLMDDGFQYVIKHGGLCTEADYSYEARNQQFCSMRRSSCSGEAGKITSYKDVSQTEEQLRAAVCNGPVSVAIEADKSAFQLYRGGVLTGDCGSNLDHGVLAVGYGADGNYDYWKVKNSWGSSWGEEGYVRIQRNSGKKAGECGILKSASYPVV